MSEEEEEGSERETEFRKCQGIDLAKIANENHSSSGGVGGGVQGSDITPIDNSSGGLSQKILTPAAAIMDLS